jgi:hypothetical protein
MHTYHSPEITELAKALLTVQAQLQPAPKDAENPFTKSNYATLNSIMDTCRESLIANSIWMTQFPVPPPEHLGGGYLGLMTKLTHVDSGQWQASLAVVPLPKADPQGMGSAMTYARRYALCAMLGIVTEEDDDGNSAGLEARSRRKRNSTHEACPGEEQPLITPSGAETHPAIAAMPKLDGIDYKMLTTRDNKLCIVATGDTRAKKGILEQAGFRWSHQRKIWWRYAGAA